MPRLIFNPRYNARQNQPVPPHQLAIFLLTGASTMVLLLGVKVLQYCRESESRFQRWRLWDFTNPGALPQARGDWCAFGAKHPPLERGEVDLGKLLE
jgi:hypothetical protein